MHHGSVSFSGVDQLQYGNMLKCISIIIKLCHSTETALIKISDHLVTAADSAALVILFNFWIWLQSSHPHPLNWFQLTQFSSFKSNHSPVTTGVPQSSLVVPLLFIIYLLPCDKIFCKFNINFHCFDDDTLLYLTSTPNSSLLLFQWNKSGYSSNFLRLKQ